MGENISLVLTISAIISFSPFFSKVLKVPTTPVEIILGSLFAYIGLIHEHHLFELVAEFGFLYLMFIAGTEINIKKILKIDRSVLNRALVYLGLLYFFSFLSAYYLNLSNVFVVILPLISVGLIATLKKEYGKGTSWLPMAMIVGSVGEIISIAVLTVTSEAFVNGFGLSLFKTIFILILFLGLILFLFHALRILFWWYPEFASILMPHLDNQEQDFRLSMALLFTFIALMMYLGLELAFGAFIAGMFIPTFFEHKNKLPHKLESYGFGFLVPIFFVHVGTSFNLSALLVDGLIPMALLVTALMIGIRMLASMVFNKTGSFKDSVLLALSHSMPLTLLIAIATLAFHQQSIDKFHYYAFILASLFEVIVVMMAIKLLIHPPKFIARLLQ
jgi:Kef-type K+ transport system membrane component KefB